MMAMDAQKMSDAIRVKRKKLKAEGVEKMVDTASLPQMNPQDILNLKQQAQMRETMDIPPKMEAPSDPADSDIAGTDQVKAELAKRMARIGKYLGSLHIKK